MCANPQQGKGFAASGVVAAVSYAGSIGEPALVGMTRTAPLSRILREKKIATTASWWW
jgi:hypothetical protein